MNSTDNHNKKIDKTFGQVYERMRSKRKFTKADAATEVMSVTALSNFESGQSVPAFDKVCKLLRNINVTLLEFDDAVNREKRKEDALLYDTALSKAYLNKNIVKLKFMLSEIELKIKNFPKMKKYKIDKWKIEAIIKELEPDYIMPPDDISSLKAYLMNLSEWGMYDIHLFGYCVNVFADDNDFKELVDQMLLYTEETEHHHEVEHAVIQTTLNIINSCLSRKDLDSAESFINHLKRFDIHEYYMFEKFTLKYVWANLEYLRENSSSLVVLKACQRVALFCDCPSLAETISQEIATIQLSGGTATNI